MDENSSLNKLSYYVDENDEYRDFETENFAFEQEIEYFDRVINEIDNLYENVICRFKEGKMLVTNPFICSFMLKSDFVNWVMENN